jgi:hypothetical protein
MVHTGLFEGGSEQVLGKEVVGYQKVTFTRAACRVVDRRNHLYAITLPVLKTMIVLEI